MRRTYKSFFTHLHSATTHRYLHKKLVHCAEEVVQCSHLRQKLLFVRRNVPHLRRITVTGMAEPEGSGGSKGAARPPRILVDQLTLSQPGGDRLCSPDYYTLTPQIFRPSATCCHALSSERSVACARAHRSTF